MLAIEEWGRGRFKPMAMLAHVVAASAKECHQLILESRGPWLLSREEASGIRPKAWLDLYRQPFRVEAAITQFMDAPSVQQRMAELVDRWPLFRRQLDGILAAVIRDAATKGVSQKLIERSKRYIDRVYNWVHLPSMRRMLQSDESPPAEFRQWLGKPEIVFFMSVVMPCWLEYQQTPWVLFQQARRGEFHALEKLIRLDSEGDKDDRLESVVFRLRVRNPAQHQLLQEARSEGRKTPISLTDVKYSLGGLLMKWSTELQAMLQGELFFKILEARTSPQHHGTLRKWIKMKRKQAERNGMKCRLKAPDINWLFNAIAKDSGPCLNDPDFCGQPNSIYKRLERNAKPWPSLWETDISRAA